MNKKREWGTWFRAALIRAIKTMAQAAIAMIGTATVMSEIDWKMVVSATIVAGILSLLTSLAGLPEVEDVTIYQRDKDDIDIPEDDVPPEGE